jgi:hypothetical protein
MRVTQILRVSHPDLILAGQGTGMRTKKDISRSRKLLIAGVASLALTAGGVALGQAAGDSGTEAATGPQAERAGRAATQIMEGAKVIRVERSHEAGAVWKVEVLKRVPSLEGNGPIAKARRGNLYLNAQLDWVRYVNTGWGETSAW